MIYLGEVQLPSKEERNEILLGILFLVMKQIFILRILRRPCTCFTGVIIEQGHRASFHVPQLGSFPFTSFSSVGILDGFFSSTKYIVYSCPKSKLKC